MPMSAPIKSALISVYNKSGLEPLVRKLGELNVKIYSTGGTQIFIEQLGIPVTSVETVTGYPSILGGRVKTLHPKIFGGILARRHFENDSTHVMAYDIPLFDLVIVDLYPFEQTVRETEEEAAIIEKIDIGGVSLIRAAAKNFADVCVVAAKEQYAPLLEILELQQGVLSNAEKRNFASLAFAVCANYDVAIADYFARSNANGYFQLSAGNKQVLRYGENPHQSAAFYGDLDGLFTKLNGKELSYNNLVDIDAAMKLMSELVSPAFAVIKHTNVCGVALRDNISDAWDAALAGDKESAFGGVLITNSPLTMEAATKVNELFFEILVAPSYESGVLELLKTKKNRIVLQQKHPLTGGLDFKNVMECGERISDDREREDLVFANLVCKNLKSNAIAIVKNKQLIGKGCGQTSRIDALRHAIEKARQTGFDLNGAVFASDAFFPFDDCVRLAHEAGITCVIQPGGSIRDNDSIKYCREQGMVMVITGARHFRH